MKPCRLKLIVVLLMIAMLACLATAFIIIRSLGLEASDHGVESRRTAYRLAIKQKVDAEQNELLKTARIAQAQESVAQEIINPKQDSAPKQKARPIPLIQPE